MYIFQYDFMIKAFIIGVLISLIIPCIGTIIVFKRLSMIGDALSHSSLAGVALGLILGINPIVGAIFMCILSALSIEAIRKKIPKYSEMAIAIIMSAGVGLAGILSSFVKTTSTSGNFNSFLFGSIVIISDSEFYLVVSISIIVIITYILLYKELFLVAFDERIARLAGVPVKTVNFIFTIITAITISIASRTIGALIVSSIMVIPVACAMQFSKSYKQTSIFSVLFALTFTILGLFISFYANLKPGGTIVIVGVITFILIAGVSFIKGWDNYK